MLTTLAVAVAIIAAVVWAACRLSGEADEAANKLMREWETREMARELASAHSRALKEAWEHWTPFDVLARDARRATRVDDAVREARHAHR